MINTFSGSSSAYSSSAIAIANERGYKKAKFLCVMCYLSQFCTFKLAIPLLENYVYVILIRSYTSHQSASYFSTESSNININTQRNCVQRLPKFKNLTKRNENTREPRNW